MIKIEVNQFAGKDFNEKYHTIVNAWCEGLWYVVVIDEAKQTVKYIRNDGQLFSGMQLNRSDLSGGTYFPTQQDAQQVADRCMSLLWGNQNATEDEDNQSNKEETKDESVSSIQS